MRRLGRPAGSLGEVGQALVRAAEHGPGTARQLAERVCVGYDAARYTASRLVSAGVLARVSGQRPAVLALPQHEVRMAPGQELPAFGFADL